MAEGDDVTAAGTGGSELRRDQGRRGAPRARSVAIFGSVARGDDTADSDLDFLVEFEAGSSLFDLVYLRDDLTQLLGHDVDVVSSGGLLPKTTTSAERPCACEPQRRQAPQRHPSHVCRRCTDRGTWPRKPSTPTPHCGWRSALEVAAGGGPVVRVGIGVVERPPLAGSGCPAAVVDRSGDGSGGLVDGEQLHGR
ncbi:MAG: nucleotidyltransferase family protein [Acidimicrobiales bacterium]